MAVLCAYTTVHVFANACADVTVIMCVTSATCFQAELQECRLNLVEQLGKTFEIEKLVGRLNFVQCLHLHSIYKLESLR